MRGFHFCLFRALPLYPTSFCLFMYFCYVCCVCQLAQLAGLSIQPAVVLASYPAIQQLAVGWLAVVLASSPASQPAIQPAGQPASPSWPSLSGGWEGTRYAQLLHFPRNVDQGPRVHRTQGHLLEDLLDFESLVPG